jgi:hypothetical protein
MKDLYFPPARLEILSAKQGLNKFALKSKLYINAIRQAFDELQQLKSALIRCVE